MRYRALDVKCIGDGEAEISVEPSDDYEMRVELEQCGISPGDMVLVVEEEPGKTLRVRRLASINDVVDAFICDYVLSRLSGKGSAIVVRSSDIVEWFEKKYGVKIADPGSQFALARLKTYIARRLIEVYGRGAVHVHGPPGRTVLMIMRAALVASSQAGRNPPC